MAFDPSISLKFKNYKSFGNQENGFENIAPINVIIGRNNSGKSALLDLVNQAVDPTRSMDGLGHLGKTPTIILTKDLADSEINATFPSGTRGGNFGGGMDHQQYGRQEWLNKPLSVTLEGEDKKYLKASPEVPDEFKGRLSGNLDNSFRRYNFKRILAERDIKPEGSGQVSVNGDGVGVTNIIQHFLNQSSADQKLVEVDLLNALNEVFFPDAKFERIQTKRLDDERWEIYLEEKTKGSISLSNSGSGLKTIILVLVYLLLVPAFESHEINQYIFGFEELENNLHPGLQRRLFSYIRGVSLDKDVTFFITTHSNVVIDLFSSDEKAQLIHVTHDNSSAKTKTLKEHQDHAGVLDDLDVRASDLLQSNGIIWVEGPSDRTYINRYIELTSDGELREGAHYQCVFYGGKLLARLTADPNNTDEAQLLKVNRNCSLVMDSDKASSRQHINQTKRRMKTEVTDVGGYVWITDEREIENTIPIEALRKLYANDTINKVGDFDLFEDYLDTIKNDEGKKFLRNKALFSEDVVSHITKEYLENDTRLNNHIKKLCEDIKRWNKLS